MSRHAGHPFLMTARAWRVSGLFAIMTQDRLAIRGQHG